MKMENSFSIPNSPIGDRKRKLSDKCKKLCIDLLKSQKQTRNYFHIESRPKFEGNCSNLVIKGFAAQPKKQHMKDEELLNMLKNGLFSPIYQQFY